MRLISCTEFVKLEQKKWNFGDVAYENIISYVNFLQQPLTLSMFVPCDENGDVLEQPNRWEDYLEYPESFDGNKEWYELYVYQQAKDRVIFEGFEYVPSCGETEMRYLINKKTNTVLYPDLFEDETIESLVNDNLTITQNAIETFKLK